MRPLAALRAGVRHARSALCVSLRDYRPAWIIGDLAAALTVLAIAVPEQLAIARLADMPLVTGFYAFIAGSVIFALFGSNPQMSVGADSTIAPLFAVGVAGLAVAGSPSYIALIGVLAVSIGMLVAVVGVLRLGWVAEFLSVPIISGFMGGVAVLIAVAQLPDMLGLPTNEGSTMDRIRATVGVLHTANGWALGIAVGTFAVVAIAERVDRRLPGAFIGLIVSIVVARALTLRTHGVPVLGVVAHGAPHLGLHGFSWSVLGAVGPLAGVVALVIISQTAATTRAFADRSGYPVEVSRDFFAVGAGNVVAGLVGAFPVNASPPRTAAVVAASGRTQLSSLVAAFGLVLLIPVVGLLEDLPVATLAAVLMFIAVRIFPVRDLIAIARYNRVEFGLAVITLLTVSLVGVQQGIAVAVGLAILDRARLSARPHVQVLGRIPSTTSWAPLGGARHAVEVPGILVALFATPLWYANADHFRTQMTAAVDRAGDSLELVVLDAIGMTDLDYTGSLSVAAVLDQLDRRRVRFAMARTSAAVRASLARSGLSARIGQENLFASVGEAVKALGPAPGHDERRGSTG